MKRYLWKTLFVAINRQTDRLILKKSAVPDINLPGCAAKETLIKNRAERATKRSLRNDQRVRTINSNTPDQAESTRPVFVDAGVQVDTTDIDKRQIKRTCAISFGDDEDDMVAWTGLKSKDMLQSIVTAVMILKDFKKRKHSSLTIEEEILIVLVKLKTNLSFRCISVLFRIHAQTVSTCFYRTVPLLSAALKPLIYWPTTEQIAKNIPHYFRPDFEDVVVVLDCTEMPIMKPKCLHCRINTYSHYKSRETAKYLIGVTPGGSISYVSCGYGGKSSDKQIVVEERVLDLLAPGQAVMTDKGFMIDEECKRRNVKLVRPPFLNGPQKQLSKIEATQNVSIAAARVHVERAIQRVRIFSFFNTKIDTRFLSVLDELLIISCAIVNISSPIIGNTRF